MISVALDTCLLADLHTDAFEFDSVIKLMDVLSKAFSSRRGELLVDFDGRIVGEYRRVLDRGCLGQRLVEKAFSNGVVQNTSSRLPPDMLAALKEIQFDDDDLPFIGVCHNTGAPYVTSERKHLRSAQRTRILSAAEVTVLSLEEFAAEL
jgi:hypothetical protein